MTSESSPNFNGMSDTKVRPERHVRQGLKQVVNRMIATYNGSTYVELNFLRGVHARDAYDTIVENPDNSATRFIWRAKMQKLYLEYMQLTSSKKDPRNSEEKALLDTEVDRLPFILMQVMQQVACQIKFLYNERFVIDLSKTDLYGAKKLYQTTQHGADEKLECLIGNTIVKFLDELLTKRFFYKTFRDKSLLYVAINTDENGFESILNEYID